MRHIIIGVGAAGITAAKTIRNQDRDADIVMVSKDDHVHSRCMLHRYISGERGAEQLNFVPENFFEDNNIYWIKGKAVTEIQDAQKTLILDDGTKLVYDKLLIATGADSIIPPVGGLRNGKNVFGLRNLEDAVKIRDMAEDVREVLIVGSGLVGMDAAYSLLELGKKVTVVEMADRILPIQLDQTAGDTYKKLFEQRGCRFFVSRKAADTKGYGSVLPRKLTRFFVSKKAADTKMNSEGMITNVILDDGTDIPCDMVIVAAGVRSSLGCIGRGRIEADRFITVDQSMKTTCDDIYAAGDVAGLSGIWPNAMKQGETAAYNMCGIKMEYQDRYAMKNTMNFYGLATLSLGRGVAQEGDEVIICEDKKNYKKAILRDGKLDSILLQGDIDYSGIYQYLIKNQIDLSDKKDKIFKLSFADFYGIKEDGQYDYQ